MSSAAFPTQSNSSTDGILLVGHGTRQAAGLAEFFKVAEQVRQLATDFVIEPCFLEIAEPDISTSVLRLLNRGVKRITVAPLLLFAAGHAKRDIPAAVRSALQGVEGIAVRQAPPLECQPDIVELSVQRFEEAIGEHPPVPLTDTLLLLVGRGNSDPSAIAEMHRFAALRAERTPLGKVVVCFVAMAEPTLDEGLRRAADSPYRRIVVQPHLLFTGQVLDQIADAVEVEAARHSHREWIITAHLGPSPQVAKTVVELCRQINL